VEHGGQASTGIIGRMPRMQPDDVAEFLRQPHVGVLATLRRDGRPYTVPVWFLHHDDSFWISGTYERVWCKQLLSDPRASLCVEAMAPVAGHVGVDGTVRVRELPDFDIWPISRLLVEKYVGRGDPANDGAVEAFFANLQYRGKRADREHQARSRAGG
jgi:PPOX class probable F420-dependent enzyme